MRVLFIAIAVAVVVFAVASCGGKAPCGAATCATCCDSTGECVSAATATKCGAAGNVCLACMAGFDCVAGSCARSGTGGGSGGGTGGATGGGTGGATGGGTGGATGGGTGGATGGGTGGAGGGTPITCPGGALPAVVPITFPATCPVQAGCATNPSGNFDYTAACIGQDEFQSFVTRLENGGCGAGTVHITGYDGGLQGKAFFMSNQVCRTVQGGVTISATVTGICAQGCSLLASGIAQAGFVGTCALDAGACDCVATRAINISNQAVAYTTGPTTLTVSSTGQTFETCLTGNVLRTREIDAGTAPAMNHEPGTATLTKP